MRTPLEQFKIKGIIKINNEWIDLSITNSTIYLIIGIIIIISLLKIIKRKEIITNRWGYIIELGYRKIEEIVKDILPRIYVKYIPIGINIFIFILINNIIGLIPYSYTTTAQFIITITMSLIIMIGVTLNGFYLHKISFFKLFIPKGLNEGKLVLMIPLIFVIELLSYLIRVVSLSVRLSANMISGHTLLKIFANFGLKYSLKYYPIIFIPILFLSLIFLLEIGVSIIQAYVFTLLTITYIRDSEFLH